jgi:flavin reductase (DIM6/NTAB) family NADH-FMN oxidoreductase RutF
MNTATLARFADAPDAPLAHGNRQAFIAAMGRACTGVTVVTTDGPAGRYGATVSAMSSVSADPPLLLVCVNRSNLVAPALDTNRHFCVNVLGAEQQEVSQVFAGQASCSNADRFACAQWQREATGAPVLADALASFDCAVQSQFDLGTHTVYIGRVLSASSRDGQPLLYHRRHYCQPHPLAN